MFRIVDESGNDATAALLEYQLLTALRTANEQAANERIVLTIRDDAGAAIAGLVGSTAHGWLLVKVLWVDDAWRGRGHGRQLMLAAERKAAGLGCHATWLDTSNASALEFYRALGFEVFGTLSNERGGEPPNHRRWFLRRTIAPGDKAAD